MADVDAAIGRFVEAASDERARLYRLQLQASIRNTSTLAKDFAVYGGFTLDDVATALPVPLAFPPLGDAFRSAGAPLGPPGSSRPAGPRASLLLSQRLGNRGVVMLGRDDVRGEVGYVPDRGVLEVVTQHRGCLLYTDAGRATLIMTSAMPETLLAACVGRAVTDVADHPALHRRDYRIAAAANDEFAQTGIIRFDVGLVRMAMPWAVELEEERRSCTDIACADAAERS